MKTKSYIVIESNNHDSGKLSKYHTFDNKIECGTFFSKLITSHLKDCQPCDITNEVYDAPLANLRWQDGYKTFKIVESVI